MYMSCTHFQCGILADLDIFGMPCKITLSGAGAGEGRGIRKKTLADYPRLAAWWHPTKNGGSQPGDHKHRRRVWLRCSGCPTCGEVHNWVATIRFFVRNIGSCPSCTSKGGSLCSYNSVAANERLVAEWHEDNPSPATVTLGSSQSYLWRCSATLCGHVWESRPRERKKGHVCPQCARKGRKGTAQK
jgi:hypothetical protein